MISGTEFQHYLKVNSEEFQWNVLCHKIEFVYVLFLILWL